MLASFLNKANIEVGCDEAGRGCLAGPVVAAAVILPKNFHSSMLNDSKQLSEKKRLELKAIILEEAIAYGIGIVDPKKITTDKVVFSAQVKLYDLNDEKEITYSIVGDDEADIKSGMISVNSPIARSLIGKKEGDIASVEAPSGKKEFEILNISYG